MCSFQVYIFRNFAFQLLTILNSFRQMVNDNVYNFANPNFTLRLILNEQNFTKSRKNFDKTFITERSVVKSRNAPEMKIAEIE